MDIREGCVRIDTATFQPILQKKESIPRRYGELKAQLDAAVETLLKCWEGEGAEAFRADSDIMRRNMQALNETLTTLCTTLADIEELLREVDARLGRSSAEAVKTP